ncbi:hypothetical protein LOTGIDRAFT_196481 [Lottia gigantea]|uniref:J domain-containing protein n=1 Tax=Lottia gigantea TaxID=225164 RepID=V3ZK48_LOTGI|nr:hypothetical protein LOTGIDRAFT_196481 [Lottia gigantea]ESO84627.1 hypothetical protein LOTGIDRAFT_196481 [Lottia gigantea]
MENLYSTLGCQNFVGVEELRRSYLTLVKEFHPDKHIDEIGHSSNCPNEIHKPDVKEGQNGQTVAGNRLEKFIAIDKAWKILKDIELKEKYDLVLKQRLLCQDWPIQDELEINEFDEDTPNYVHVCRCGGKYILNSTDVRFHLDYVCCDSCSLCVKILYLQEFPD